MIGFPERPEVPSIRRWWSPPPRVVAVYSIGILVVTVMFLVPLAANPAIAVDIAWLVLTAALLWLRPTVGVWLYLMVSLGLVLNGIRLLVIAGSSPLAWQLLVAGMIATPGFWVLRSALRSAPRGGEPDGGKQDGTAM